MKNLESEELTQEVLQELLHYNPETGVFTWNNRDLKYFSHCKFSQRACKIWNAKFANKEAKNKSKQDKKTRTSYVRIRITLNKKTKLYKAHRLVFLYLDGKLPPEQVEHIDGNGLNNKRNNLRKVREGENHKNMPMQKNNTSGCTGVTWNKKLKNGESKLK